MAPSRVAGVASAWLGSQSCGVGLTARWPGNAVGVAGPGRSPWVVAVECVIVASARDCISILRAGNMEADLQDARYVSGAEHEERPAEPAVGSGLRAA